MPETVRLVVLALPRVVNPVTPRVPPIAALPVVFNVAEFTNPDAVMLVPEALARVVLPVTFKAPPVLMSPEVVRAVPEALVKLMRAALVSPEMVRAVEETAERDEAPLVVSDPTFAEPETFSVAPFRKPEAVMLVEETFARELVALTERVPADTAPLVVSDPTVALPEIVVLAAEIPEVTAICPATVRLPVVFRVAT